MHFNCPQCNKRLKFPEGHDDMRVRCPGCKHEFDAPGPDPMADQQYAPEAYCNMGDVYTHLGRHDEAIAAYKQAIAIDPEALLGDGSCKRLGARPACGPAAMSARTMARESVAL